MLLQVSILSIKVLKKNIKINLSHIIYCKLKTVNINIFNFNNVNNV